MLLNIVDYAVLGVTLLVCAIIGVITGRNRNKATTSEYLLADRRMSVIPVAFSIMATIFSAIAMAGGVGEMYLYGAQYQISSVAGAATKIIIGFTMVPVFHNMEYTSIYEYLENRFDRVTRLLFSGFYLITNVFYLGLVLYVPALAITKITGIPYWVTSSVTGLVCTFYCVLGGFKAVVWTDVLQTVLMFSCVLLVIIKGTIDVGGLGEVWTTAVVEGDRLHLTVLETETTRYSMWSLYAMGIVFALKDYGTNQAGIQRFLSVKCAKDAQKSIMLSAFMMLIFKVMLVLLTLVIYARFANCDPLNDPNSDVTSMDQILIHAIEVTLSNTPGLAGLALSGILSGALSTFSSYIIAFAAVTLVDFMQIYCPRLTSNDRNNIITYKVLTAVYGVIAVLFSFVVPFLGGAMKTFSSIVMGLSGPICGVMILAIFFPRANPKATKVALVLGTLIFLWIAIGAQIYPINHDKLPSSTAGCLSFSENSTNVFYSNATNLESDEILPTALPLHDIIGSEMNSGTPTGKMFFPFSGISFAWFGPVGTVSTIFFGYVLSYVFVGPVETNPKLLCHLVCRPNSWKNM